MQRQERSKSGYCQQASADSLIAGTAVVGLLERLGCPGNPRQQQATTSRRILASPTKQHLQSQQDGCVSSQLLRGSYARLTLQPGQLLRAARCQQQVDGLQDSCIVQVSQQMLHPSALAADEPQPQAYPGVVPRLQQQQVHPCQQSTNACPQSVCSKHGYSAAASAATKRKAAMSSSPRCTLTKGKPPTDKADTKSPAKLAASKSPARSRFAETVPQAANRAASSQRPHSNADSAKFTTRTATPAVKVGEHLATNQRPGSVSVGPTMHPATVLALSPCNNRPANAAASAAGACNSPLREQQQQPLSTAARLLQQMRHAQQEPWLLQLGLQHTAQQQTLRALQPEQAPSLELAAQRAGVMQQDLAQVRQLRNVQQVLQQSSTRGLQSPQQISHDTVTEAQYQTGHQRPTCIQQQQPLKQQQQLQPPMTQQTLPNGTQELPSQQQLSQSEPLRQQLLRQEPAQLCNEQQHKQRCPLQQQQVLPPQRYEQQQQQQPSQQCSESVDVKDSSWQQLQQQSDRHQHSSNSNADLCRTAATAAADVPGATANAADVESEVKQAGTSSAMRMQPTAETATQTHQHQCVAQQHHQQHSSEIIKRQLQLARMCAKHGLPLPQQQSLEAMQLQLQRNSPQWGKKDAKLARTSLRWAELLRQLQSRSTQRRTIATKHTALPLIPSAAADSVSTPIRRSSVISEQQCCTAVSFDRLPLRLDTPASELHAVDGLQYVHALLASIQMPAGSTNANTTPVHQADLASDTNKAAASGSEQLQQQQQQTCFAALTQLHSRAAAATASSNALQQPAHTHDGQLAAHHNDESQLCAAECNAVVPQLQLQEALVLLGIVTDQNDDQLQALGKQHQAYGRLALLHSVGQQYMLLQPKPYARSKQELLQAQLQLQQTGHTALGQAMLRPSCCLTVRRLCIWAMHVVCEERREWCQQQEEHVWGCLKQVRKELWQQRALAEAAAAHRTGKHYSNKAAGSTPCNHNSAAAKQTCRQSPSRQRWEQQQQQLLNNKEVNPAQAAAVAAATKRFARVLTVPGVVAGKVDFATAYKGWEGTDVVVQLLTQLLEKLWCELIIQVLHDAAVVSSDMDVLTQQQQSTALPQLTASAAFATWRSWSAARAAARTKYRKAKVALQERARQQVLTAWHQIAAEMTLLHTAEAVLQQHWRSQLQATAFKGWLMVHAGWRSKAAFEAVAVLWHARIVCAKVLVVWSGAARRAATIKAAVNRSSHGGKAVTDDGSIADTRGSSSGSCNGFRQCCSSFAEAVQQQQAWKEMVLAAVAEAAQQYATAVTAAVDAGSAAVVGTGCDLTSVKTAVTALRQKWRQDRQQRAAQHVHQMQLQEQHELACLQGMPMFELPVSSECSSSSGLSFLSPNPKPAASGSVENDMLSVIVEQQQQCSEALKLTDCAELPLTDLRRQQQQGENHQETAAAAAATSQCSSGFSSPSFAAMGRHSGASVFSLQSRIMMATTAVGQEHAAESVDVTVLPYMDVPTQQQQQIPSSGGTSKTCNSIQQHSDAGTAHGTVTNHMQFMCSSKGAGSNRGSKACTNDGLCTSAIDSCGVGHQLVAAEHTATVSGSIHANSGTSTPGGAEISCSFLESRSGCQATVQNDTGLSYHATGLPNSGGACTCRGGSSAGMVKSPGQEINGDDADHIKHKRQMPVASALTISQPAADSSGTNGVSQPGSGSTAVQAQAVPDKQISAGVDVRSAVGGHSAVGANGQANGSSGRACTSSVQGQVNGHAKLASAKQLLVSTSRGGGLNSSHAMQNATNNLLNEASSACLSRQDSSHDEAASGEPLLLSVSGGGGGGTNSSHSTQDGIERSAVRRIRSPSCLSGSGKCLAEVSAAKQLLLSISGSGGMHNNSHVTRNGTLQNALAVALGAEAAASQHRVALDIVGQVTNDGSNNAHMNDDLKQQEQHTGNASVSDFASTKIGLPTERADAVAKVSISRRQSAAEAVQIDEAVATAAAAAPTADALQQSAVQQEHSRENGTCSSTSGSSGTMLQRPGIRHLACAAQRRASDALFSYSCSVLCRKAMQGLIMVVQRAHELCMLADAHWQKGVQMWALQCWTEAVKMQRSERESAVLRHYYVRWSCYVAAKQHMHAQYSAAMQHWRCHMLCNTIAAWRSYVASRQIRKQQVRDVQCIRKRIWLHAWKAVVEVRLQQAAVIKQVQAARMMKVFRCWRDQGSEAAKSRKGMSAAATSYERVLLNRCFQQWLWPLRGRALLSRVFAAADQRWNQADQQQTTNNRHSAHAESFRTMQLSFQCWLEYTAAKLSAAAARAAEAAASTFQITRLCTRAWHSWQLAVRASHTVRQQLALRACCFGAWSKYASSQLEDRSSLVNLRRVLRVRTLGSCQTEQQWHKGRLVLRVMRAWAVRALFLPGQQYRLQLLAKAVAGWFQAVQQTQQLLLSFQLRWQHQRLLQKAVLLWRGLVLLLKQQRDEAAAVDAWRSARIATAVLQEWRAVADAASRKQHMQLLALQHYAMHLMQRMLRRWGLVICVYSAAKGYYQQRLMSRLLARWHRAAVTALEFNKWQKLDSENAAVAARCAVEQPPEAHVRLDADRTMHGRMSAEALQIGHVEEGVSFYSVCMSGLSSSSSQQAGAGLASKQRSKPACTQAPQSHHLCCRDCMMQNAGVQTGKNCRCCCVHLVPSVQKEAEQQDWQQEQSRRVQRFSGCPYYEVMADCTNTVEQPLSDPRAFRNQKITLAPNPAAAAFDCMATGRPSRHCTLCVPPHNSLKLLGVCGGVTDRNSKPNSSGISLPAAVCTGLKKCEVHNRHNLRKGGHPVAAAASVQATPSNTVQVGGARCSQAGCKAHNVACGVGPHHDGSPWSGQQVAPGAVVYTAAPQVVRNQLKM